MIPAKMLYRSIATPVARGSVLIALATLMLLLFAGPAMANGLPELDKTVYHTWEEVDEYLEEVASSKKLKNIVELIPIGYSREGRPLRVLQISRKGIPGKSPATKPATFINGAHHAREHVTKEAVLALIDRIIHKYGKKDAEGQAITYLVDAGTFYLLPWVNPDGGMNQYFHNSEQRKTNYPTDEPQIGAAACDDCGDGLIDEDSPDLATGDVGIVGANGQVLAFANNGIISRMAQLWYDGALPTAQRYNYPVVDQRIARIQPQDSIYTFNHEGLDPDADGEFAPYSGEDFVGGTDPNRNYGEPLWGDCAGNQGCSWLTGSQTYAGPSAFSEPETAAVAAFLRSRPNIVSMENLHSGINEVYPPDALFPDPANNATMDQAYTDAVAQYISQDTGYEVVYGGQYSVKGDTTDYAYTGSSHDPTMGIDFFAGGVLTFTTEVYGMGSTSGSAEAVRDWFPHHYQQFDTTNPQGNFRNLEGFPWCTTCDPALMPAGALPTWTYRQYVEYFIFTSTGTCGGADASDVFHCGYWGHPEAGNEYYADHDIFAYFNPPSANRHYKDWNDDGDALVRTVDRQLKHLLYRLYISPFVRFARNGVSFDGRSLNLAVENTGFLRSSVLTNARLGDDPYTMRCYDRGNVEVEIIKTKGFTVQGAKTVNIGWLGGGMANDPAPRAKTASFAVTGLNAGDEFLVRAGSEKTGYVLAEVEVEKGKKGSLTFELDWTNDVKRTPAVDAYFAGPAPMARMAVGSKQRTAADVQRETVQATERHRKVETVATPQDMIKTKGKGLKSKRIP